MWGLTPQSTQALYHQGEQSLAFLSVPLKIISQMQSQAAGPGTWCGSMCRCCDGWSRLQHGQLLLAHLVLPLFVFRFSHIHQQQFGTVPALSGSQGLSVVPSHLQCPRQVAALAGRSGILKYLVSFQGGSLSIT